jgi:hypothetical protein
MSCLLSCIPSARGTTYYDLENTISERAKNHCSGIILDAMHSFVFVGKLEMVE